MLLVGASPAQGSRVIAMIRSDDQEPPKRPNVPVSLRSLGKQNSLDWSVLRQYVASLLNKHEAAPAPGAHQPGKMTYITKQSWDQKWTAVQTYFKEAERVPGSKSMLKRVWKLEVRLKERRAKTHSKCDTCSDISGQLERLVGCNTDESKRHRTFLFRQAEEHEAYHLGARSVLDEAGLQAIVNPRYIWTIMVDAATQRNFELPKFQFRPPKCFTGRPFWSFKLMASYVYGNGFYPFLVHDSQFYGANLTWTVLWLTLTALYEKHGYWPKVIHIQLDNTKGENKNETMVAIAAWLAGTKVQQVRVFFLPVGHTHILIDHVFGIITVGLRRVELLTPLDLMQNIDASMAKNSVYQAKPTRWIHCLWDFKRWVKAQMPLHKLGRLFDGEIQDEHGRYRGMFDYIFNRDPDDFALLQYRERCSFPYLPENGSCKTIKSVATTPPALQEIKPKEKWFTMNNNTIDGTILLCMKYARSVYSLAGRQLIVNQWKAIFDNVPSIISLLQPEHRLAFKHFTNDAIPRLLAPGAAAGVDETPESFDYEEWKRAFSSFRSTPLAFDPVISTQQTEAQFRNVQQGYLATLGHGTPTLGSTTHSRMAPVILGAFVLAKTENIGVRLFAV